MKTRMIAVWGLSALVVGLVALLVPAARAGDGIDQTAVNRADGFLNTAQRGRAILGYVHLGTKYRGHSYQERRVVTRNGNRVPGHFALVYSFEWAEDGKTDLAFLCDARGNVYEVQVVRTNAEINQPWVFAKATIQVLGNALIEAFRDNLTPTQRQAIQTAVNNADVRNLLAWSLNLEQALGR
ncbi:MAG: hypothetical protein L0Z62_07060 [Gemmataceae bacterium]|nr:hypothetical protein [Gemmataceae bacterium]